MRAAAAGHLRGDPPCGGWQSLHELFDAACVAARPRCVWQRTRPMAVNPSTPPFVLGRRLRARADSNTDSIPRGVVSQWAHDVGRSCWQA
jgi:hypothetical protein